MSEAREIETVELTLGHVVNPRGALPADAYNYGPGEIAVRRLPAGSAADLECLTADGQALRPGLRDAGERGRLPGGPAAPCRLALGAQGAAAAERRAGRVADWAGAMAELLANGDRLAEAAILLPGGDVEEPIELVLGAERDAVGIA